MSLFSPSAGKLSGLRMVEEDARRLMETYGKDYADRAAENREGGELHAVLVIDVLESASHPASRWLYATRAAYLALDPASLAFLTATILTPPIKRERVRFVDNDCRYSGQANSYVTSDPAVLEALHVRMSEQITQALKSSAFDRDALRAGSALVRMGSAVSGPLATVEKFEYVTDGATGVRREVKYADEAVDGVVRIALILSLILGVLLSIVALLVITRALWYSMDVEFHSRLAARIVVLRKQGDSDPSKTIREEQESGGEDVQPPPLNPWLVPFKIVTTMLIEPIRKRNTDTMDEFVSMACVQVPLTAYAPHITSDGATDKDAEAAEPHKDAVPVVAPPVLYLRTFVRRLEIFALEKGLHLPPSAAEVQQALIQRYDARVHVVVVRRIFGLRWKSSSPNAPEPMLLHDPVEPVSIDSEASYMDVAASLPKTLPPRTLADGTDNKEVRANAAQTIVRAFINEHCVVDLRPGNFIDLESKARPGVEAFKPLLKRWCAAKGIQSPELRGSLWSKGEERGERGLPKGVKFVDDCRARKVRGLVWKEHHMPQKTPRSLQRSLTETPKSLLEHGLPKKKAGNMYKFVMYEFLTVSSHVCVAFLLPILVSLHALILQNFWAGIFAPEGGVNGQRPLMWIWATGGDVRTDAEQPNNGFFVVPLVAALLWESAIFAGVSLLRLIVHYAVHPKAFPRMIMATRYVYMVVIILHLFVFFAYLGTVAAWLVLAAALEPKRFLPYGIAVVVIAVVGSMVFSQMSEAARKMKERVAESFDKMIQSKMRRALKTVHEKIIAGKRQMAELQSAGDDDDADEMDELNNLLENKEEEEKKVLTAADIFAAINTGGDDELEMDEFQSMFDLLDLNLTENQKEQLFAFCDVDCSGRISEKEFTQGWDRLKELFLEASAGNAGVSRLQIVITCLYLVVVLGLLIAFVLMALAAWNTNDSFTASVQSGVVIACGRVSTAMRKRGRAEQGNIDGLVGDIMQRQNEDSKAADDGGES